MAIDSPSHVPKPNKEKDSFANDSLRRNESSEDGTRKGRSPKRSSSQELKSRSRSPSSKSSNKSASNATSANRDTNSTDPESVRCRVFIGNLNTDKIGQEDLVNHFSQYGKVVGCSLHMNFGFVQYGKKEDADRAVTETHGQPLFGKRVDANIASERRKTQGNDRKGGKGMMGRDDEQRSRSRRRSHSRSLERYRSRSPMSKYDELLRRDDPLGRGERMPPRDNYEGRRNDVYYDSRDHYGKPPDPFARDPYGPPPPKTADCEVIATSGDLKDYAESIQSRLRAMGISANTMFPPPDVSILEIVDRISRSGSLYAVVITSQNMYHKSCTLNLLHGAPQEHRNMPLDDALAFVARNFNQHLSDSKDRRAPAWQAPSKFHSRGEPMGKTILTQDSYISGLLNMAVAGMPLKVIEVNHLIEAFIKYKNDIDTPNGQNRTVGMEDRAAVPFDPAQPPESSIPQPPAVAEPLKEASNERPANQSQDYYSQQPYSYGAPSASYSSSYQEPPHYRSSTSGADMRDSYASSGLRHAASSTAYTASSYTQESPNQPMSAYPNYYDRA